MNGLSIVTAPLVPMPVIAAVAALALLMLVVAVWRKLRGWALRGLAAVVLLGGAVAAVVPA